MLTAPTDVQQPPPETVIEAPPTVQLPKERPRTAPAALSPASRALVSQAQAQRQKGDLPGATVSLERALRIEPNNPLLWILAIRKQIAAAVDLIVYLTRFPDGTRKVTQVSEVAGMESEVITLTDIFQFQQTGTDAEGRPVGQFRPTGLRPMFASKLDAAGFKFERRMFMK